MRPAASPGGCSYDNYCGAGIIDARYAVAVAAGTEALPPDVPPPPPPPPAIPLQNGVTVTGISVPANGTIRYELLVPNGASNLLFAMYGGTGDADIYVRRGAEPTLTSYDCRPFSCGNNENCFFPAPQGGRWYVTIRGFSAATGVSLYPSFTDANWPRSVEAEATALSNHRTRVDLTWTLRQEEHRHLPQWRHPQDREEQGRRHRYVPHHRQRHHELQALQQRYAGMRGSGRDRLRLAQVIRTWRTRRARHAGPSLREANTHTERP